MVSLTYTKLKRSHGEALGATRRDAVDKLANATVFDSEGAQSQTIVLGNARKSRKRMAPQVGLEPTTLRLTAGCSAIELLRSVACGSPGGRATVKLFSFYSIRSCRQPAAG